MIMKVACFLSQHSPILGQPASSHTVCNPCARTMSRVAIYPRETGALTLIQSGFFNTGISGLCAFSGWRGRFGGSLTVSSTTTMWGAPRNRLLTHVAHRSQDKGRLNQGPVVP